MTYLSAIDAFTNPDSPLYYIVGSAFLVLIIAALVIFLLVSKRKNEAADKKMTDAEISNTQPPEEDSVEAQEPVSETEKISEPPTVEEEKVEEAPVPAAEVVQQQEKSVEQAPVENPVQKKKPAHKPKEDKEETQPTIKFVKEQQAESTKAAPKKTTAKKTQKAFIDRLIAAKDVHSIYNELKNAILSYPGMKAKLGKDSETFSFADSIKAELYLEGSNIVLKTAVEPDGATAYGAQADEGELKTKLVVWSGNVDSATKLITYTMNMAMLTRNDKHRHVNYIQKAIEAKNKAKAKQAAAKANKK